MRVDSREVDAGSSEREGSAMRSMFVAVLLAGCGTEVIDAPAEVSRVAFDQLDSSGAGPVRTGRPSMAHAKSPTKLRRPRLETRFELDFGEVAFWPGTTVPSVRQLVLHNSGGQPLELTNLRLSPDPGSSLANELCVGTFGGSVCTPLTSLQLDASETRSIDLVLRLDDLREKHWVLSANTNDPRVPVATWNVSARPVALPPCNWSIQPQRLSLGAVEVGATAQGTLTICNLAPAASRSDRCSFDSFRIEGAPEFTTHRDGSPLSLEPGACEDVLVKVGPRAAGAFQATLVFHPSSPFVPARIPLEASAR